MLTLHQLLKTAVQQSASDLHIISESSPVLRVNGKMLRVKSKPLSSEECQHLVYSVLTEHQKSTFEEKKELDFSFSVKDMARFRGNLFYQKGCVSGVFRRVPILIPQLEDLGLPKSISQFTRFKSGLVLATGPTGCGKSTTLAALLDRINEEQYGHILTVEDPIEFVFKHKKCIVNQRELELDTLSFADAAKHVLRQDPDYMLIGELRDLETMEQAMRVAETGHLVLSTLHTDSAVQTINRMVNAFPEGQQDRVRVMLSFLLRGVISQKLVTDNTGQRMPLAEVLFVNSGIQNLIRENKIHQIYGMMQVGQKKSGMQTLNQSILSAVVRRKLELKRAFDISPDPGELNELLRKAGI